MAWEKEEARVWGGKSGAASPDPVDEDEDSGAALGPTTAPTEEPRPVRTSVIPQGELPARSDTDPHDRHRRRFRPASKRVKRIIRHVDPISVLKLSLVYYACFLVLWLVFVAVVYQILDGMGLFEAMESLARSAAFLERKEQLGITLWWVERWALLIGVVFLVIATLVNVFLAFLYNVASDVVGGLSLTFVERDL